MALQVETGNFALNTGGSTTTVTTAFQGKGVILMTHVKTSEGESAIAALSIVFADGTTIRSISASGDDASATSNVARNYGIGDTNSNIYPLTGDPSSGMTGGALTSLALNPTNMVLTFNATPASAMETSYILFGGSDIVNAKAGAKVILTTDSGATSYTGMGFKPDVIFFAQTQHNLDTAVTTSSWKFCTGFAASSTKRWSTATTVRDGAVTSATVDGLSIVRSDACLSALTLSALDFVEADFTSFNSDGYTINVVTAPTVDNYHIFLALKGGSWDGGVDAKPTTATTQTFTTTGITPKLLVMVMTSATVLDTLTSEATTTIGATDGTNQSYAGAYHNDALNTVAKSSGSSTALSHEMNATANATFTSFSLGQAQVSWSAAGTAFLVPWFAAGDGTGAASSPAFGDYSGQFKIIRPTLW